MGEYSTIIGNIYELIKTHITMNYTEEEKKILGWVRTLAASQGMYGRLYNEITSDREKLQMLVDQNFGDIVDMVMWLEG